MIDKITHDDIVGAVNAIANRFGINQFHGIPIIEHPVNIKPKIQIRDDFKYCTPEFRVKTNARLLEMFGTVDKSLLMRGQVFKTEYGIVVRSDDAAFLKTITLA